MNCLNINWSQVSDFFNNQSVGAFLGAFSAFILVVLNDRRREFVKVRNLRAEVKVNLANSQAKLDTVRRNRIMLREQNLVMPAPILRFNTAITRQLSAEVLDKLSTDQRQSIDALCYTMEGIDSLLEEIRIQAQRPSSELQPAEQLKKAEYLLNGFGDAIVNLKRFIEMCNLYLSGNYKTIVTKQYDRLDYEEPLT